MRISGKSFTKVFALLLTAVCLFAVSCSRIDYDKLPTSGETEKTSPTQAAVTTLAPTEAPQTTASPAQTTIPPETSSPALADTPDLSGKSILGSGTIYSDTKTKLNLFVKWTAYEGTNGKIIIEAETGIECYSLFVGARSDGKISIGGESFSMNTAAVKREENTFAGISFGTFYKTVEQSDTGTTKTDIDVLWHFGGNYAGIPIDWIEIKDTITISK